MALGRPWFNGAIGLETIVLDPASRPVNRKAGQRKKVRIDAKKVDMLRCRECCGAPEHPDLSTVKPESPQHSFLHSE